MPLWYNNYFDVKDTESWSSRKSPLISLKFCSYLSERDPPRLRCLNMWFPVSDAVWGGFGDASSLEEACLWKRALRVWSLCTTCGGTPFALRLELRCVLSAFSSCSRASHLLPPAVSTAMDSRPLEPYANSFFFKLLWSRCVLSQRQKSN